MNAVRRVVIRDRQPVFEREVLVGRVNRATLAVAAVALAIQIFGAVQAALGLGNHVSWFEHLLWAFVALLWLVLGLMVFLQRPRGRAGRLFLLSSSFGSIWLGIGTFSNVNVVDAALYSAGLLLFPPLLFSFARAYTGTRSSARWEPLLLVPGLLLLVPMAHDYVTGPKSVLWKAAILSIPVFLLASVIQTARDMYAETDSERQAQLRALLFGLIAGTVPGIFTFGIPLLLYTTPPIDTGWLPALVLLFLVAMSYSVLLFEFSEADLIVRRGVVYGVLTFAIVAVYALLGALLVATGASVQNVGGGLSFVAVTIVVGAAFTPIRRVTRRLVDWLLYGQRMDRWSTLQAFSERLGTVMQPEELGTVLVHEIADALHLRGALFFHRRENGTFELAHRHIRSHTGGVSLGRDVTLQGSELAAALGEPSSSLLLVHGKPWTAGRRNTTPEVYRPLDALGVALAIPLSTRFGLEAVLCLQGKQSHDAIDADDIQLLAPVIRQASAALDNALLFARLEEKVEELRHAYVRIAREQESERGRLARELHDGTAQELANLITLATVAERQMNGEGPPRATLDRLRRQAEDAYQGVRRASYALRPVMLDDFGLAPTLDRYLGGFQESTGIDVAYQYGDTSHLSDDAELALFRVVQECMENVRKHSGASRVDVNLEPVEGGVTLAIQDNGRGLPVNAVRGIGLAGMRERVEAVGGAIDVHSEPGAGLRIVATVPWEAA